MYELYISYCSVFLKNPNIHAFIFQSVNIQTYTLICLFGCKSESWGLDFHIQYSPPSSPTFKTYACFMFFLYMNTENYIKLTDKNQATNLAFESFCLCSRR